MVGGWVGGWVGRFGTAVGVISAVHLGARGHKRACARVRACGCLSVSVFCVESTGVHTFISPPPSLLLISCSLNLRIASDSASAPLLSAPASASPSAPPPSPAARRNDAGLTALSPTHQCWLPRLQRDGARTQRLRVVSETMARTTNDRRGARWGMLCREVSAQSAQSRGLRGRFEVSPNQRGSKSA